MHLNVFIAAAGICSRRKAKDLIISKQIFVNGIPVIEPWYTVQNTDVVTYKNKKLIVEEKIYLLYNKPQHVVCTLSDPQGRKTIADIFAPHFEQRLFPIGRLDAQTTGLIIITNDGALSQKLAHPKYEISKTYHVTLDKTFIPEHARTLQSGVHLEDGIMKVDSVQFENNHVYVQIHSGKKRIVRRLFAALHYTVMHLDRTHFSFLTQKNIERGSWRKLTLQEIAQLTK
jgi:23S rRNA pseudouridine2605 synthase